VLALLASALTKNVAIISVGVFLGGIWGLVDGILALVDTRMQRTLHDRICGTRVILLNN
jgi:hypothetical protein